MMSGSEAEKAKKDVLAVLQRWLQGTMDADADALDAVLAEGYTYTHATTGSTDSREKWLESFRTGGRRYHIYEAFDLDLRVYPGTVVMTGHSHQQMSPRGERIELNTTTLSVWVQEGGAWKCAGWQATRNVAAVPRLTPTS